MPRGKGTYGKKRGRPPKKKKGKGRTTSRSMKTRKPKGKAVRYTRGKYSG